MFVLSPTKVSIRKRYAVLALLAAAILAVLSVWLREGNGPGASQRLYQGKTLEAWFNQLQGSQGDAVVATFREIGTDAVVFLGAQSRKHDSVLKRGYITLWPKLPAFLKSKLKQPTNAVPIRVKALGALRRMRPGFTKLEPGMTILIEALNDPSEEVRSIAEGALGDIGPEAAAAVHALIRSVERGGFSINGIWALGRIGPEAKPADPLLKAIVRRKTGRQLVYAAEALWRIEQSIYGELTVKEMAIPALGQQGSKAKAAILRLEVAARSNDREVRKAAEDALRRIAGNEPSTTKE